MIELNDIPNRKPSNKCDDFQGYEQKGRDMFADYTTTLEDVNITKYSKDEFSPWDVAYVSGGTRIIGEIKLRNNLPTDYPTWILEEEKLSRLEEVQNKVKVDTHIHYINIYSDGSVAIWDISDARASYEVIGGGNMPSTTVNNVSRRSKDIIYLPTKDKIK